jgi:hypothetical protein
LNRRIDPSKVARYAQEMKARPYLAELNPILVNTNKEIIDR